MAEPARTSTARPSARRRKTVARKRVVSRPAPSSATRSGKGNRWLMHLVSAVQAPVALATSQADWLVSQLVRTGNLGQREAERLVGELRAASGRAQGRAQKESAWLDKFIESRIEDVLNRVNIPSRSDIERLNDSVDLLTAKVEALVGRQERGGSN